MKQITIRTIQMAGFSLLFAFAFWAGQQMLSVRVDGTRADCEAKFPGQRCMIVWVPEFRP